MMLLALVSLAAFAAGAGIDYGSLPPGVGISEMVPMEPEPEPSPPEGLLEIPKGSDVASFAEQAMEPRHAVAVAVVGRGTKRHQLLQSLAEDEELQLLLAFGASFAKGKTSLAVYRHGHEAVAYGGKWTRSAIQAWLLEHAYPLVNQAKDGFPAKKYLARSRFGVVLVAASKTEDLARALEPHAARHPKLKFTFLSKSQDTEQLSKISGIWTDDELLLMEEPRAQRLQKHSHQPVNPKYRLEGVTPERIQAFFDAYDAGSWPRYYVPSSPRSASVVKDGVRELTSWDFVEAVTDPAAALLVLFVSQDCAACSDLAGTFREAARRVRDARAKASGGAYRHLTIARIDQSANEHSEVVRGTPLLRYWPGGLKKRTADVDRLEVGSIWSFLEEKAAEDFGVPHAGREEL
mmetsp:Transcript_107880/g.315380  ORF Transcript_107880/g.315380 Transcript_107880/m.315380 type:complete len:406 (+) Transcript_107880:97-1314(+)